MFYNWSEIVFVAVSCSCCCKLCNALGVSVTVHLLIVHVLSAQIND
jgi:hypothetical protein